MKQVKTATNRGVQYYQHWLLQSVLYLFLFSGAIRFISSFNTTRISSMVMPLLVLYQPSLSVESETGTKSGTDNVALLFA